MRWLATFLIAALFALNAWLPHSAIGRRGHERTVHTHVQAAAQWVGAPLPALEFDDAEGNAVRLGDLLPRPILLVFERSVDW